ncbi:hypothetical protein SprV_0200779200 [Sparganum proliferum]
MKLNVTDLIALKEAFSLPGKGYDNKLTLNKDQFVEAMPLILNRVSNTIFFHEAKGRLFITFNQKLTLMEMKPEQTRVFSHDTPVVGAIYNAAFNQVVTVSQCGTISYWLVETGQRVKKAVDCHNGAEVTCLTQDPTGSNFYTGATDGTVKVWDMNAHCHHTLICFTNAVTDISHIVVLRRAVIVMGNSKHFTAFKMTNFDEHYVFPSEWKGAPDLAIETVELLLQSKYKETENRLGHAQVLQLIKFCLRTYLTSDGTIYEQAIERDQLQQFKERIDSVFLSIQFTMEGEEYNQLLFLDVLVLRQDCGGVQTEVFRKTTNTTPILTFNDNHLINNKRMSSIIMAIDKTNVLLATADVDGNVKMWNIEKYCLTEAEEQCTTPPPANTVDELAGGDVIRVLEAKGKVGYDRYLHIDNDGGRKRTMFTMPGASHPWEEQEDRWKLDEKAREITSGSGMSTETAQEAAGPVPEEVDVEEDETSLHTEQTPFQNMDSKDFSFGLSDLLKSDNLDDQDYLNSIKEKLIVWDKTVLDVTRQTNMSSSIVPKVKFDEKSFFPPYLLEFDQHMQRLNKYVTKKEADARVAAAAASAGTTTSRLPDINENNMVVSKITPEVFSGNGPRRGSFELNRTSAPATAVNGICRDQMTYR